METMPMMLWLILNEIRKSEQSLIEL